MDRRIVFLDGRGNVYLRPLRMDGLASSVTHIPVRDIPVAPALDSVAAARRMSHRQSSRAKQICLRENVGPFSMDL